MQGALFNCETKKPKDKIKLKNRSVAVPYGKQDRSGKYWYEKYRDDINGLHEESKEIALKLILDLPYERFNEVRLLIERWHKANPLEQDNFRESIGM